MKLPARHKLLQVLSSAAQEQYRHEAAFVESSQPVLWLSLQPGITDEAFFSKVAQLLKLPSVSAIEQPIAAQKSLAEEVAAAALSQYLFYPYIQGKTLHIVTADPYPQQEMIALCKQHADFSRVQIALAPPAVIWTALNQVLYPRTQTLVEEMLAEQHPQFSSKGFGWQRVKGVLAVASVLLVLAAVVAPVSTVLAIMAAVNVAYFVLNPAKLLLSTGAFFRTKQRFSRKEIASLERAQLPIYTILVPLKHEVASIPHLLRSLQALEYPPEKLDIKLAVEVTDTQTLAALQKAGLSVDEREGKPEFRSYHVVKVPVQELSTKPRSCNYALQFARGKLVVIYDAEDEPDPQQLLYAYLTFLDSKLNTICLQAPLNYYNPHQNVLTRCFTAEYTFWFDVLLPALVWWGVPIPLGGTSNHFQVNALKEIGHWDAYNVTEDAEVGWRLSRLGYRAGVVDSYTLEEANSQVWNWVRQRTRWQKGFLLTLLIYLRDPLQLYRDLGFKAAVLSLIIFATTVFLPLINLWLWLYFISTTFGILLNIQALVSFMPEWLFWVSLANLLVGNGIYIAMHAVGIIWSRKWGLLWILPLLPAYWVLQAVSSYRSVWQLLHKPYLWEKTVHGLYKR